ncbi:TetR/AcrR family transcriptional regulator [Streptomyces sp. NPDC057245]|uniref:TetR/AcrR family transcriptional regulator n=1 Tax=Streptomyces TaxID=1883 RepID=UPI001C1DEB6B|nr:TetR/AcrR family transcriptional regulator [Streptomyces sp. A108]MBU6533566.1 TetR/AcrR family transcriptional regulator [Streptomyces sp. A108]
MDRAVRRRGSALEEAILDAAWAVLTERGFEGLTLEAVAKQANTSRPVLSRRWATPASLATAALARYVALNPVDVPDLGDAREELKLLLRRLSDRAPHSLMRFVIDMREDLLAARSNIAGLREQIGERDLVQRILARGVQRGEIDLDRVTPRIVSLPIDLTVHEGLMTLEPVSDEAIREIVDDIFLPLVRRPV